MVRLLSEKSVRVGGPFRLASGRESDFFVDCKQSLLSAEGHALAGLIFLTNLMLKFEGFDAVAGVALGGCPIVSAVSTVSFLTQGFRRVPALYVRKERKDHGSTQLVEGKGAAPPGSKVVLLEDVVTTGGSSLKCVQVLRDEGYEVLGVMALVDRLEGAAKAFADAGVRLESILTRDDFVIPRAAQS